MTTVGALAAADAASQWDAEGGAPMELAIAFTDLEDFTAYTEAEGDNAASRLLIGHHRESVVIVHDRGGRVLKWLGDGLMLTFPEPEAAVLACLDLGESAPLRLRAGIHVGHVMMVSDDVFGHVVNLAARVAGSAAGGQLVVTDHVRRAIGDVHGIAFDGPHLRTFKGIEGEVSVYVTTRSLRLEALLGSIGSNQIDLIE